MRNQEGLCSLVAAGTGLSASTDILTGDVYLSIVLSGRMFAPAYRDRGYSTTILSRSVEDVGTLISPLVPWNVGGAFVAGALGVSTLGYVPFAFACWMSPIIGLEMDDDPSSSGDEGSDGASSHPAV